MDIDSGSKDIDLDRKSTSDVKHTTSPAESPSTARAPTPVVGSSTNGPSPSAAVLTGPASADSASSVRGKPLKRTASEALPSRPSAARTNGIPADRFLGAAALGRVVPIPGTITGPVTLDQGRLIRDQALRSVLTSGTPSNPVLSGVSAQPSVVQSEAEQGKQSQQQPQSSDPPSGTVLNKQRVLPGNPSRLSAKPIPTSSGLDKQTDAKAQQWLSAMRARSSAGPGGMGVLVRSPAAAAASAMDVEPQQLGTAAVPPRSSRAGVSFAESVSDGEAESDTESVAGGLESTAELLRALLDVSAFNAECLAKLSGLPMPDFEADTADTGDGDQ